MRTRTSRLVLCSLLLALSVLPGRPVSAADPADLAKSVDAVFADFAKPGSPGCSLAVIRDGGIVYEKGYGLASVEHGVPIDPRQTVFDIGSTSKQLTATAILLLAQDGKLSLDDDVHKFLPELPDYGTPVTLRHLLHHTRKGHRSRRQDGAIRLAFGNAADQEAGAGLVGGPFQHPPRRRAGHFHRR